MMDVIAPKRAIHERQRIIVLSDLLSRDLVSTGHYLLKNSRFTKLVLARIAHHEVNLSSHIRAEIIALGWSRPSRLQMLITSSLLSFRAACFAARACPERSRRGSALPCSLLSP